jgi:hypothetical protein
MWVMYDSTDVTAIPEHAPAVAGYVGGEWETWPMISAHWPHAHRLSIAINAAENADCLDIENGDAQPRDAPAWILRQHQRGLQRPAIYCDLSTLPMVHVALQAARIPRTAYREWTAHYTDEPHITPGADATQWTSHALNRDLDESLCNDAFFGSHAPLPRFLTRQDISDLTGLAQQTETIIDRLLALSS